MHDDPDDSTAGAGWTRVQVTPEADESVRQVPGQQKVGRPWLDARHEGGSGAGTRWPEQAVERGIGCACVAQAARNGCPQGRELMRSHRRYRQRGAQMVCGQVLRGLARIVQVVSPVLVMMVASFLPMQCCVVKVSQHVHRQADAR